MLLLRRKENDKMSFNLFGIQASMHVKILILAKNNNNNNLTLNFNAISTRCKV